MRISKKPNISRKCLRGWRAIQWW